YDAHLDYAPFVHGVQFSNSNPFRHVRRLKHVASLTQVGIRSLRNTARMHQDSEQDENRVVTMGAFRRAGPGCIAEHLPEGADVYVSIDIDVLDLALVPGCVSAEPNGMAYEEFMASLRAIAKRCEIVGFDLVEVSPPLDVRTQVTSYLGAHTIIEFLGHILG
ncbi:MAG: arginase family protein, partial [Nocardioidaceae bacterium]